MHRQTDMCCCGNVLGIQGAVLALITMDVTLLSTKIQLYWEPGGCIISSVPNVNARFGFIIYFYLHVVASPYSCTQQIPGVKSTVVSAALV